VYGDSVTSVAASAESITTLARVLVGNVIGYEIIVYRPLLASSRVAE
jgi:hypothetical protein